MNRLSDLLMRLDRREKGLLALLVVVALPLALTYLVALPALEARENAARQNVEARDLLDWTSARHADWQALAPTDAPAPTTAPIGLSGLEAALTEAGLRDGVTALETAENGRVILRLDKVLFVEAARFLEALDPASGYRIGMLSLTAGQSPATVTVDVELVPAT